MLTFPYKQRKETRLKTRLAISTITVLITWGQTTQYLHAVKRNSQHYNVSRCKTDVKPAVYGSRHILHTLSTSVWTLVRMFVPSLRDWQVLEACRRIVKRLDVSSSFTRDVSVRN
jgi:hypothetical protein